MEIFDYYSFNLNIHDEYFDIRIRFKIIVQIYSYTYLVENYCPNIFVFSKNNDFDFHPTLAWQFSAQLYNKLMKFHPNSHSDI